MSIPIEDFYEDIIGKAQRGLGLSDEEVCRQAGLAPAALTAAKSGRFEEAAARRLAAALRLQPEALIEAGRKTWYPEPVEVPGLARFNTPCGGMAVNTYLVWDGESGEAAAFDAGAGAGRMLDTLRRHHLNLKAVFITHGHCDHTGDLERLRKGADRPPVYAHHKESIAGAVAAEDGRRFSFGRLEIRLIHTPGHTPGGASYYVTGLVRPAVATGDALFAGSTGGAAANYAGALAAIEEKILCLPPGTVVCPGHGPVSTVAEEKAHNPFFPKLK